MRDGTYVISATTDHIGTVTHYDPRNHRTLRVFLRSGRYQGK